MEHEIMIKEVKSTSKDGKLSKENRWNHENCDHCHHEWDKNRMNNNNSKGVGIGTKMKENESSQVSLWKGIGTSGCTWMNKNADI